MSSNNLHKQILHTALNWAERNNYSGYSKFDALNSPILKKINNPSVNKYGLLRKKASF